MINKRLLIKNLLAHNDENSFYDKKRKIDISFKEGKAKFLKHICALSYHVSWPNGPSDPRLSRACMDTEDTRFFCNFQLQRKRETTISEET